MKDKNWIAFNSHEMGDYVRFCLWLGCCKAQTDICRKHDDWWGSKYRYKSDGEKYYGFKYQGMEAFL